MVSSLGGIGGYPPHVIEDGWEVQEAEEDKYVKKEENEE